MKSRLKIDNWCDLDIPKEFDLERYSVCKRWGLNEWSKAISHRAFFRKDWNRSTRKLFDFDQIGAIYDNYKNQACRLLEEPSRYIDCIFMDGDAAFITDQSVADLFEDAEDERLSCSSWRADYLEWSRLGRYSRYESGLYNNLIERVENTPTWIMKRNVLGVTGVATIHVDMCGENADILKEFRAWLKKTRKEMKLPKVPNNFDTDIFSDWCNDRILPCFDLLMYQTIHNGKFRLADITESLFPLCKSSSENIIYEDRIRRTIIPNALKVVSLEMALALTNALERNE